MNRSIIHESSTDQSSMNPFETRTWRLQCKTMSGVMLLVIMYFKHLHDNREQVQREMMTCNVLRNRRSTANRSHGIVHANRQCAMRCNAYIDNKKAKRIPFVSECIHSEVSQYPPRNVNRNRLITANRSHEIIHANRRIAAPCKRRPKNPCEHA